MIIKEQPVTRPTPDSLTSSVLDHARAAGNVVADKDNFGLRNEAGLWPSYNCLDTLVSTALCPDPTEDKEFAVAPWVPAFGFAVYGAVECNLIGLDRADQVAEIERVFLANEGKGVERALLENRFVAREPDVAGPIQRQGGWEAPTDLSPVGVNIDPKVALAILEGYAATVYAGKPTIHMPRAAATILSANGLIKWNGALAFTANGSKVAIGGGYDEDDLPLTGRLDMFATGEVYIEMSESISIQVPELTGSAASTALGLDPNTSLSLVERAYRAAVDCFVVKATATLWTPPAP